MSTHQLPFILLLASVLTFNGLEISLKSRGSNFTLSAQAASCDSNIRTESFSGIVARTESNGKTLSFDAWTYGDTANDLWENKPDSRWFKIKGENLWVSSAVIWGLPPSNPSRLPNCGSSKLPINAAQADQFFKLQYYHSKYNSNGPRGSSNCGPTSLAMVLKLSGLEPRNITTETSIDYARHLMFPTLRSTIREGVRVRDADQDLSSDVSIATGISTAGGKAERGRGWDSLNQKLREGKPVISYGYLDENWRKQFPSRVGSGTTGHINAILGITPNGNYIVADPMHEGGPVEMTRNQLAVFYQRTSKGEPEFTAFAR
jgi:Peptidase_C39 like family